jgi:hypothetical protein
MLAAENGYIEVVEALIEKDVVDVNGTESVRL